MKTEADRLLQQGITQHQTGQFQTAIDSWLQALTIYQKIGDRQAEAYTLKVLGFAYDSLGEYQKAIESYVQSLQIDQEIGDKASVADSLNRLGAAYASLGKYQEALESYQQSLTVHQEIGDRRGAAQTLNNLGLTYHFLGHHQKAIEFYQQSLVIDRIIGDKAGIADSLINLGLAYKSLGQYQKAIESYQQSLTIDRKIGDRWREVIALNNLGSVCSSLKEYQKAIEFYQQKLDIARQVGHREWEADALDNLSFAYESLGQYHKTIDSYQQSLVIAREKGDQHSESNCLYHLGKTYSSLNQYQKAIEFYQQSLTIFQEMGNRQKEAKVLGNLGLAFDALEQYQEAIEYYQKSLTINQEIGNLSEEAECLGRLGLVFDSLEQYQEAIEYHQQSLTIAKEISYHAWEGGALCNLGNTYLFLQQYQQAIDYFQQAILVLQKADYRPFEVNSLANLGLTYSQLGQYQEAVQYHKQALSVLREIGDQRQLINPGITYSFQGQYQQAIESCQQGLDIAWQIGHRYWELKALINLGNAYDFQGQHQQAIEYYQQAIEVQESIQSNLKLEELKTSFAGSHMAVYERLIGLLCREGHLEEAFNYVERSRARAFLDQFANGPINFRTGVSAELLQQEETLKAQISALRTQLTQLLTQERSLQHQIAAIRTQLVKLRSHPSNQLDTEAIASVQKQLLALEKDYTNLLTELKLQSPESASLVSVDVASLDEIQSLLDADTTLAEYFLTENLILAFIITRDSFQTIGIGVSREDLTKKIEAFRGFGLKNLRNPHPKSLQQLYDWLIAPLKPWLTTNKLAIVPHGVLHYLPFAALSKGDRYLCDDYTLITLPSASILRFLPQKRKPSTGTLLALGNPTTPLPSLPSAEKEVNAIASLYSTQPLIGEAATESAVFSQAGSAEILHLSAHGEFNQHNPLFSTLHLAADEQHDGRLEVHDIYALDLTKATNLVVLSACQTQLGELSRGDEVVGLNRAFLYAGTPSVIATLWSVQDDTTALLMERFYTHLRSGIALAQALRQAQIELRAKYPHPFYWAAFVLTGDGGSASSPGID